MVFQEGMRKLEGFPAAFFFWAFHLHVPLSVLVLFELQVSPCPSTTPGTDAASASSRPLVRTWQRPPCGQSPADLPSSSHASYRPLSSCPGAGGTLS